jgi:hypothetical protein
MVDFTKRAAKAAAGHIAVTETVLAGTNVMPTPFQVAGGATTGGAIAGGLVGAAIGAAVDKRRERKQDEDDAGRALPEIAGRPAAGESIPKNGALLGITEQRLLVWKISGIGKPKELLFEVPLDRIESVAWHDADTKWFRGSPKSTLIWVGLTDGTVIPTAAISLGPAGKYVDAVVEALAQRMPGKVSEFTG